MDQRVEKLEQNVDSLITSHHQMKEQLAEILTVLGKLSSHRDEGEGSHRSGKNSEGRIPTNGGHSGSSNNQSYAPRLELDFPRFNGTEDPTSWLCRAEQFLRFHEIPMEDQVSLASFHLEGEAQLWYQLLQQESDSINWTTFKAGLLARYGPTQFYDYFGELTKLQQTSTVKEYQSRFEQLLAKVGHLPTVRQVSCFVSGLKEGVKADVLAGRPTDLSTAIGLARLYEARNTSLRRTTTTVSQVGRFGAPVAKEENNSRSPFPIRRMSPAELKERREKGLCYNCNEKFVPGHRCKKLFLIEACSEDEEDDVDMEVEALESSETPGISLHAISGGNAPETMRVVGVIQAVPTTILLDSGSSHNFLSESLAQRLNLQPVRKGRIRVMVASGERLVSRGKCPKVSVKFGKFSTQADFFILPLEGYEAVLGTQWLRTLGEILWDFSKLVMKFHCDGNQIILKGLTDKVVDSHALSKEVTRFPVGAFVQVMAIDRPMTTSVATTPELHELLEVFGEIFQEPVGLPPNRAQDHHIPLQPGSRPVCSKPYRHPYYQKGEIERLVSEMLSTGVIHPSNSPFSSPVVMVKKKDGTWRMCIDYRSLNQITIKDKFPIPLIDELLDELSGAKFFSKLDLRSGYHQIRVQPSDVPKTAFRTHHGHFEFLVMPFGLTNAPSTFQALMNDVFKEQLRRYVLVFFDDILVYSSTWQEHLKHLQVVLELLRNHELFVKKTKCTFGQQEVHYLGHIISQEGVCVDPEKITAMVQWPLPRSPRAMRGFLGLTGYYRKFIQDYGKIAAPLTQMLRKNSYKWSPLAESAFQKLKDAMTGAPVLALPDFSQQFVVECDASGAGVGAVLRQDRPIAFHSQALQGKNLLMSTYEKEMLALVIAVRKWKHYLLGRKFIVRTDQKSLQYLWSQKIATEAQQKWLYKLMGLDFSIEYKKGSENKVADALSRRTEEGEEKQLLALSSPVPHWVDSIREDQQSHPQVQQLIQRVHNDEAIGPWEVRDGLLLFKGRLYLGADSVLRKDIVDQFHTSSHEGLHKTFQRIRANFYWPKMREDIKATIRECEVCQRHKVEQLSPAGLLQPLPIPKQVWEDISMDFVDGLPVSNGKSSIMVVVDRLSKYSHFIPITHPYTAVNVAQIFFENVFKLHGMPRTIVCDRDRVFTSGFWTELFRLNGTKFNFSSAYHPQTDGQSEVVNRTLEMYLRCFTSDKPKQWVRWLCWAEFCYNTSWHSAIKRTPFEVVYGREPPTLLQYVPGTAKVAAVEEELMQRDEVLKGLKDNIKLAQNKMKKRYDLKHRDKVFEVGSWVYVRLQPYRQISVSLRRNAKLAPRYYSPFRILERIGQVAYRLELPATSRIHPVFHVSKLKEQLGARISSQPQLPITIGEQEELGARPLAVLDRRVRRNKTEVLIHWQG